MDRLNPKNERNARLLFIDGEEECDICDGKKEDTAHIEGVGVGTVSIICKKCIKEILKRFEEV
jgi:hypothetical protein